MQKAAAGDAGREGHGLEEERRWEVAADTVGFGLRRIGFRRFRFRQFRFRRLRNR
jgi:hypothetical protein